MNNQPVRVAMLGCGRRACEHMQTMFRQPDTTHIMVVSEPSPGAYNGAKRIFEEVGMVAPPNEPDLSKLLKEYRDQLDVAFIVTPHAFHFEQASTCLEAGLDVLLEKPMVVTAD